MVEGVLLKINCGSGQRPFKPPFINVDVNPKWNPDFVADGANMPMFANDSADLIVSHHVAEHAGCGDSAPMFNECRRVLTPGGSLIVCVPDMRALAEAWIAGRLTTQIYLTNVYGAFLDSDLFDRHRWGFDARSLREFLLSCGFSKVVPFDWRAIESADIAQDFWILGMEAIK